VALQAVPLISQVKCAIDPSMPAHRLEFKTLQDWEKFAG
jgi:hypothetical protein